MPGSWAGSESVPGWGVPLHQVACDHMILLVPASFSRHARSTSDMSRASAIRLDFLPTIRCAKAYVFRMSFSYPMPWFVAEYSRGDLGW